MLILNFKQRREIYLRQWRRPFKVEEAAFVTHTQAETAQREKLEV